MRLDRDEAVEEVVLHEENTNCAEGSDVNLKSLHTMIETNFLFFFLSYCLRESQAPGSPEQTYHSALFPQVTPPECAKEHHTTKH